MVKKRLPGNEPGSLQVGSDVHRDPGFKQGRLHFNPHHYSEIDLPTAEVTR